MRRGTPFPGSGLCRPKVEPRFVGPTSPPISSEVVYIDIDNDAATGIYRFHGDLKDVDFLRYEVNSMGARLRAGGSAAVIGVGGGRDVMSARAFRLSPHRGNRDQQQHCGCHFAADAVVFRLRQNPEF